MDVDLAVPARLAGHHVAVETYGQDVVHRDLVEADAVRLHEEQRRVVGQPHRDVAAGEVVLPLPDEHLAGPDDLLLQLVMRHLAKTSPRLASSPGLSRRSTRQG